MKFADRSALERTAIDAWIRLTIAVREKECMDVADDFKQVREKAISESPGDIPMMLRFYEAYRSSGNTASYTKYFQRANPEAYAALLESEGKRKG